ncbi:DUF481 domain-containing protein [Thalassotalea sp. HSM 43]|uniref:DUF481 domain-containing protein n=1 Tax=Thalassotalea sp. HSM 43 TaxID=2552945 RepID=UPI001081B96C|nr:DUF481 domain-containing protein [Thalassotalea sp. HSM 43]QBY05000.1 DUF481 domain-containing protein [Thalassotalea sp. HSM 43]
MNALATLLGTLLIIFALYSPSSNAFQEQTTDNKPAVPDWPIDVPAIPQKWDWILLKKGELLGGELISMYQDTVEFDSDEVGLVNIKMKDIAQIRTNSVMSIRMDDGLIAHGQLLITEDKIKFINQPDVSFPRIMLLSIAPSEKSGDSLWDGDISIGMNFKSGNSERFDYTAQASATRLTSITRTLLAYTGIFSEVEDPDTGSNVKTEENHRFNASFDWFYSRRFFFRLPSFEYYTDEFKNIEYQVTTGVAAGYILYDEADFKWDIYAGPSIQYTRFNKVDEGEKDDDTSPVILLGTMYERDLTDDIEYVFIYSAKFVSEESGKVIHHLETGIEIEVLSDFDIDLKAIVDHVDQPIPDEDGNIPEQTDILFIVGLSYDF